MQRVINFSGGKTSALMTILCYQPGDLVIFCDTGREHIETYNFIKNFENFEKIPIIKLSYYNSKQPFNLMYEKRKYKILPNRVKRICTVELKIKTCRRYLKSIGINQYENLIGFRYDELLRIKNRKQQWKKVYDKFPLYEKKINKAMVNDYWSKKEYNLNIPSILGNCDLCFMKGKNAIISILTKYPELAEKWINDEKLSNRKYFPDITYEQLLYIAKNNLFKDYDLNEIKPSYNCACTN